MIRSPRPNEAQSGNTLRGQLIVQRLRSGCSPGLIRLPPRTRSGPRPIPCTQPPPLGSRVLRDAADAYDRAARAPFGRIPVPTPAGNRLRRAARLLSAYGYLTSDPSFRPIVLITRLAALVEAVAALRETHDYAAQAAGALGAAGRLHTAEQDRAASGAGDRPTALTAATLARAGFPVPPDPGPVDAPRPVPRPGALSASPRTGRQPRRQ